MDTRNTRESGLKWLKWTDMGILFTTLHTAKNVVVNIVAKSPTAQELGH